MLEPLKGGETIVQLDYVADTAKATLQLGEAWRVQATDELLYELKIWLGKEAVRVSY